MQTVGAVILQIHSEELIYLEQYTVHYTTYSHNMTINLFVFWINNKKQLLTMFTASKHQSTGFF